MRFTATRHATPVALYTTSQWLADVSLFQEAWQYVCTGAANWWWSQQLCQYTVGPLVLLMATEGELLSGGAIDRGEQQN